MKTQQWNTSLAQDSIVGLSRVKLFLGLSRTPHALLDMATPGLAALLWLGAFPPLKVILLGLLTVFAGYTCVYALNDVIDHRSDAERIRQRECPYPESYLDSVLVRHPIAQGLLTLRESIFWATAWGLLALAGAYLLNPLCLIVFLAGCAFETFYCTLWSVSHWKTVVSGAVKTSGPIAAVVAVDPAPSLTLMAVLFLWLFFWEIGGQNIPADWADVEEDRCIRAKTIPAALGPRKASLFVFFALVFAVAANLLFVRLAAFRGTWPYTLIFMFVGGYFLLVPACRLLKSKEQQDAMALFNRASCYPLASLVVVGLRLLAG
jgi:4-hydroxybenzoate polyprenyltransferase